MSEFYLGGGLLIAIQAASILSIIGFILMQGGARTRQHIWGGTFLSGLLILVIGLRPVIGLYVDMTTYAIAFERSKWGISDVTLGDPLFDLFTNAAAALIPVGAYFFLCAVLYVVPKTIASRQLFGPRATLALAAMASSFFFYNFATNGIRNGIAASLALLAMTWPRLTGKIAFGAMAIFTHISLLLSMTAYVIGGRFKSVKIWLAFWVCAIPLSFLLPEASFSQIASLQIDERTAYFGSSGDAESGFRPDFILYSAIGVAAIAYWKFVRKFEDQEFDRIACTYLIANGVWVLINRVAFSNRFAYLSWFLIEVVILFPLLRNHRCNVVLPAVCLVMFNIALTWAII